jgi:2-polyprenyl-6-methoxyphenol hydroxylase-like FAD-dependent oxidoreductase
MADVCQDLPSPDEWRKRIKQQNDGSMPREPYQRCSQAIFEAWLKPKIQAEPLIDSYFGMRFEGLVEEQDRVITTLIEKSSGETHTVKSKYVIGCDGAGSRVRRAIDVSLTGGPT